MIDLFLKSQEKTENTINLLAEEIRECSVILPLLKMLNNALSKQVLSAERKVWRTNQYSRREFVEILRVPASVDHKELKPTICKVLQHIGVDIIEERIESILGNFSRRKDCQKVMRLKSELSNSEPSDTGFLEGTKLFRNKSL